MLKKSFSILLATLALVSCVEIKQAQLFEQPPQEDIPESIAGFYQLTMYEDDIPMDMWKTENQECIKVERVGTEAQPFGTHALKVTWDKDKGVCDFIGMGFGWAGWMSKNMAGIIDSAALSFKAKLPEGQFSNLPLAFGLEDYSGKSAWLGYSKNALVEEKLENGWSHIELPLSEFNWAEQNPDPSNIKQLIVQFEAVGTFYFDEFRLVPRAGGYDNRMTVPYYADAELDFDAKQSELYWKEATTAILGPNRFKMVANQKGLFIHGNVKDPSPLINDNIHSELWKGDDLELLVRTNPHKNLSGLRMSSVDRQFHFGLSKNTKGWEKTREMVITDYKLVTEKTEAGYQFELFIPWDVLGINPEMGVIYPFEMALNQGDENGRQGQIRWNTGEGFDYGGNSNYWYTPNTWGELILKRASSNM